MVVQHVMGLRNPQACLLLWIAVPEDWRSRGIRLPITSLFWIVGQAHLPQHICAVKREMNDGIVQIQYRLNKSEMLTVACNLVWSKSDETKALSGSELPDTD